MSQQAVDILSRWIAETLRAVPEDDIPKEAARLAAEFSAYAEDANVDIEDLEVDLGEDLISHMAEALRTLANEETADLLDKE